MKEVEKILTAPTTENEKPAPIWGGFIIDILKTILRFNQLSYGTKKKF